MEEYPQLELGYKAEDIITGIAGVVIGRVRYFTGCDQYLLTPEKTDKDGVVVDNTWLDINRIKLTSEKPILEKVQVQTTTVFGLGQHVRNKVNGVKGYITGHSQLLDGPDEYCVTPRTTDGSKYPTSIWCTANRLERTGQPSIDIVVHEDPESEPEPELKPAKKTLTTLEQQQKRLAEAKRKMRMTGPGPTHPMGMSSISPPRA